ncbi:MAG: NADH-quinone oxidoreductase subunit M [Bacteroidales bacterium]|nr:NADH-quinone oxidoreductase subunit M [Bacteroidales bacterium]
MNLLYLIWIPFLTLILILLTRKERLIKIFSLTGSGIQLIYSIILIISFYQYRKAGFQKAYLFEDTIPWFSSLSIHFSIGVDSISLIMITLTALVVFTGILVSWNINSRVKEFFTLIILLSLGAYGFFISTNLFVLFFFLELAVIPKYLLIGIWGSGKKEYSAMKLALMLMGGSALILLGFLGFYHYSGAYGGHATWDIRELANVAFPIEVQRVLYLLTFTGFGVFTALFPFHTWAPDGHSSAPTAASMFLAGISMKLGGYGCLRISTYLLPDAAQELSWIFIILASIAILYGAFATMMQKDLKYMNAYSSVSHCGFVVLGIAMLTRAGFTGAILQMVSHGVMTALFFAAIGMLYERTHTRMINEMGGLMKPLPFIGSAFIVVGLCSLGLPGLSGFVAEATVFVGAWERTGILYRTATLIATASIVVTAVYILRAMGSTLWGVVSNKEYLTLKDATWNEKVATILLISGIVFMGFFPFLFFKFLNHDVMLIMNNIK